MYSQIKNSLVGALAAAICASSAWANTFQEASKHLDLDGTMIGYIDFEGDGAEVGAKLNDIYQDLSSTVPDVPQIPLDFTGLFDTLGFGSIKSIGMSSKELDVGLHRNRSVTLVDGELSGLFGIYGLEPSSFRAATIAPADATTVMSGKFKLSALRSTVIALLSQVMGPMGEGMATQSLGQPIPGTDVTMNEAIDALSNHLDFILVQKLGENMEPDMMAWLSIANAGSLLPRLKPLSQMAPITFTEDESGLTADLSALMEGAPIGLFAHVPTGSGELQIFTDKTWAATLGKGGATLENNSDFKRLAARLPKDAAFYSYSAGFDPEQIYPILEQNAEAAPYLPLIKKSVALFLGDFLAPNASALYSVDGGIVADQYAAYSYKQAIMALPAMLGAGVGLASAIPSLNEVSQDSEEVAIASNLRQISIAAQMYMIENEVKAVGIEDIVGSSYLPFLQSVSGESYEHIVITSETAEIGVTLPNGEYVSIQF